MTDDVVVIVAKNAATGKHERVEVPQHYLDYVIKQMKSFRAA